MHTEPARTRFLARNQTLVTVLADGERKVGETITITSADRHFSAYLARPATRPAPSVVVLHEVFGVNSDLRATCDELAERGFLALCPDLFWRQEPGVDLSHWSEVEWQKGLALYNAYDYGNGLVDIADTLKAARTLDGASGKAGVMGFCMGGLLTFLTAAHGHADATVAYYPGGAEQHLNQASTAILDAATRLRATRALTMIRQPRRLQTIGRGLFSLSACGKAPVSHRQGARTRPLRLCGVVRAATTREKKP
jgi:dienelactone hydrolase